MRQLAAAVNVISTAHQGQRGGLTATAVMSLTAEPPQLAVAINRTAGAFELFRASGCFGVNVLSNQQRQIAEVFSGAGGIKGASRFDTGQWSTRESGAPLLDGAAASFDCRVSSQVEFDTHVLFVGRVESVRTCSDGLPLLYLDGSWASLVRTASVDIERYEAAMLAYLSCIDRAVADAAPVEHQLGRFVRDFALVNIEHADVTRAYFGHENYAPAADIDRLNGMKRQFDHKLECLISRGMQSGSFRVEDPHIAARAITGMMVWMHRWYDTQGHLDSIEIGHRFADLVQSMVATGAVPRHSGEMDPGSSPR